MREALNKHASPSFRGQALAEAKVRIAQNFGAFTEGAVVSNCFGTRMTTGVGGTYAFGGNN